MKQSRGVVYAAAYCVVMSAGGVNALLIKSSFIPSATPTVVSNTSAIISGYKKQSSLLFAKPKRKAAAVKGGKVQVKLLKKIDGTGGIGDVVMVAPAFWENSLKKTNSAVLISDDEVSVQNEAKAEKLKAEIELANDLKEKIQQTNLKISKKAGPDGHLFGGVGTKVIMEELRKKLPKNALSSKAIKVTEVCSGEDGKPLDHDIKEVGNYQVSIALQHEISTSLKLEVVSE